MKTRFWERKYHSSIVFAGLLVFGFLGGALIGGSLSRVGTASLSPALDCENDYCRYGTGSCQDGREQWECDMTSSGCEHDMCEAPE